MTFYGCDCEPARSASFFVYICHDFITNKRQIFHYWSHKCCRNLNIIPDTQTGAIHTHTQLIHVCEQHLNKAIPFWSLWRLAIPHIHTHGQVEQLTLLWFSALNSSLAGQHFYPLNSFLCVLTLIGGVTEVASRSLSFSPTQTTILE